MHKLVALNGKMSNIGNSSAMQWQENPEGSYLPAVYQRN